MNDIESKLFEPTFVQSCFTKTNISLMDIHPVKPWILFTEKKSNGNVVLYDYEEETILHQFFLLSIYDSKKQEINILKMLEKSYNNITLPEYDEQVRNKKKKI